MIQVLEISPTYFAEIESGRKPFEVRLNDRNFLHGQVVILNEFDSVNNCHSGRVLSAIIGVVYTFPGMNLLCDEVCVFALFDVKRLK